MSSSRNQPAQFTLLNLMLCRTGPFRTNEDRSVENDAESATRNAEVLHYSTLGCPWITDQLSIQTNRIPHRIFVVIQGLHKLV
jgi:hypothetical protein